jgi:hypothetical protein
MGVPLEQIKKGRSGSIVAKYKSRYAEALELGASNGIPPLRIHRTQKSSLVSQC